MNNEQNNLYFDNACISITKIIRMENQKLILNCRGKLGLEVSKPQNLSDNYVIFHYINDNIHTKGYEA